MVFVLDVCLEWFEVRVGVCGGVSLLVFDVWGV